MKQATKKILCDFDNIFEIQKKNILQADDIMEAKGTTYYVSNIGDDSNDGRTPQTPWKTLERVSAAYLLEGDAVLFKRGDLFRGTVKTKQGVTYAAYGKGDKPKFYGCHKSLADPQLWELYNSEHNIWKCKEKMLDCGTIVFNDGEAHSRKLIPSYKNMQFVCRGDEKCPFVVEKEMTQDLDVFWEYDTFLTRKPSKGEDFPIPEMDCREALGDIYLRCDKGNPGEIFETVESVARTHMFAVGSNPNVTIDNLCIKYVGMHGVSAGGYVVGLHVTNCEFGWIGGCIQHYFGTDPNYPQGLRGTVTRFGNAIEVYGGCDDYVVSGNYIYEVYDAGITHQVTTSAKTTMTKICYTNNIIEKCVYGIEYFLDQIDGESESYMDDVVISGNYIRLSGYGWGQQRHNIDTPALIKGWSYKNTAHNFLISDNVFDRCAYKLLHLVSLKKESLPEMCNNTYIQTLGGLIGQFGFNELKEPDVMVFNNKAKEIINYILDDKTAKVYFMDKV